MLRMIIELLEARRLLCGSSEALIAAGVPESIIRDGHISSKEFAALPTKLQQHIDKHMVEDNDALGSKIDFDKVLGLPTSITGNASRAATIALPDFFPSISGSFSTDQTSQPGRTLLRFGTQVNNMGAGPGTFISASAGSAIPTGAPITSWVNPDGSQNVLQAVYNYDPSTNSYSLNRYEASGRFVYHAGHSHFHFEGYAYYRLRQNVGGQPGPYLQRNDGSGEVVGAKTGFCLINVNSSFTLPGGGSSTGLPGYNGSGQPSTGCGFLQGVNVGRADVYSSGLQGQWLDVTGVPNGNYFMEITLDGENAMRESDETNNTKSFAMSLNVNPPAGGITPDEYDQTGGPHNETLATATDFGALGTWTKTGLNINFGWDFDYYKFTATSSGAGSISVKYVNGDVNEYLYDAEGTQIGASTNPATGSVSSPVTETVNYNFVKGATYYLLANAYNSTTSSNYQVSFAIRPTVDYATTIPIAVEFRRQPGKFQISRNGPTDTPLAITLGIAGTATPGADYTLEAVDGTLNGNTLTLGNLASSATLIVRPVFDGIEEAPETVLLTINTNSAYVSSGTVASMEIWDRPPRNLDPALGRAAAPGGVFNGSNAIGTISAALGLVDDKRGLLPQLL